MKKTKNNTMLSGAAILMVTGVVAKILSALYRVPLQNIVGNTGFYVYQQVYPIYGIGMVLALSGWPMFISKIVSEQPDAIHARFVVRRLFWLLSLISLIIFIGLYGFALNIAQLMADSNLAPVIQSVAWMFLFMPFLTIGRGFSQGQMDMRPTAVSQLVEQIVRVVIIIGVAIYAALVHWNVYHMGMWAMAGAPIAAFFATGTMFSTLKKIWEPESMPMTTPSPDYQWRQLLKRLWQEGGLVAMIAAMLVILQLMDAFSLKKLLVHGGMVASNAEALKGVYDRGQPLIQLGMVLATSLGTALLPNLRGYFIEQKHQVFKHDFAISLRLSLVLALGATGGMIAIMPQLNQVLFNSRQGNGALSMYMLVILPATLILVIVTVLQAMDKINGIRGSIWGAMILKYGLNVILVPKFGIVGASVATLLALIPVLVFVIYRVPSDLWQMMHISRVIGQMVRITLMMTVVVKLTTILGDWIFGVSRGASSLTLLVAIVFGASLFVWLINRQNVLTREEWQLLPKGSGLYQRLNKEEK
ncbi:polysaccharide biosynthesis protein [Weissella diestrammenae]|uniref:Polysaccharide biosynthesis protein n=1 Tax=Weissella diestrammenae TaxID=1162633 RepID=A0A7G9T7D8_9LACO|nr:polysaccharide biosynthesis protein [Weissella diestrammenae]MCM0582027.1 polysaccharide biosynthesis protein [Weissella diestrammenae]QNN76013.1 polysaccharide biosynthesis protein [Weissella diestrammenae]